TRQTWVFKGGTCLKKCYFETYRFSEDLDFTIIGEEPPDTATLLSIFHEIALWVYEKSGIEIPLDQLRFDAFSNPRGHISVQGKLAYRGPLLPRGSLPRIKLDLTTDETLVQPPVRLAIAHPYPDAHSVVENVLGYSHVEIFAEKIRALAERLRPRDLYDVVNLYRHAAG
ncbi:MAG: nucleotidyl transferase AbiEii/AbiGii toxin family protein, partial [bacterium]